MAKRKKQKHLKPPEQKQTEPSKIEPKQQARSPADPALPSAPILPIASKKTFSDLVAKFVQVNSDNFEQIKLELAKFLTQYHVNTTHSVEIDLGNKKVFLNNATILNIILLCSPSIVQDLLDVIKPYNPNPTIKFDCSKSPLIRPYHGKTPLQVAMLKSVPLALDNIELLVTPAVDTNVLVPKELGSGAVPISPLFMIANDGLNLGYSTGKIGNIISFLLRNGANAEQRISFKGAICTPLSIAMKRMLPMEIIKTMIDYVDIFETKFCMNEVSSARKHEMDIFTCAILTDRNDVLGYVLQKAFGKDESEARKLLNRLTKYSNTITYAVQRNNIEAIMMLCQYKAEVSEISIVSTLLKAKPEDFTRTMEILLSSKNNADERQSTLNKMLIAFMGRFGEEESWRKYIDWLLDKGANLFTMESFLKDGVSEQYSAITAIIKLISGFIMDRKHEEVNLSLGKYKFLLSKYFAKNKPPFDQNHLAQFLSLFYIKDLYSEPTIDLMEIMNLIVQQTPAPDITEKLTMYLLMLGASLKGECIQNYLKNQPQFSITQLLLCGAFFCENLDNVRILLKYMQSESTAIEDLSQARLYLLDAHRIFLEEKMREHLLQYSGVPYSLFLISVIMGRFCLFQYLLDAGISIPDKEKIQAVMLAILCNRQSIFKHLMAMKDFAPVVKAYKSEWRCCINKKIADTKTA